mgnify:CR=1 FL=1
MAFVTLKDVAQRAGVSAAAVSQILHNKGRFSSDTRRLVLKTVEENGVCARPACAFHAFVGH